MDRREKALRFLGSAILVATVVNILFSPFGARAMDELQGLSSVFVTSPITGDGTVTNPVGISATPSFTSITGTTVNGTTGNFTFIDAGTLHHTGQVMTFAKSDGENVIQSMTEDGTTSGTVGALALKCGSNIAAADACLAFRDSAGNLIGKVTEAGSLHAGGAADTDTIGIQLNRRNYIVLNGASGNILISANGNSDIELQSIGNDVVFGLAYPQLTHNEDAAPVATDCDAAAEAGRFTGNTATGALHLCKGSGGWSTIPNILKARTTGAHTLNSATATEVTELQVSLPAAGTYVAEYFLITQSSATGTGLAFGINVTANLTTLKCTRQYPSDGTSAASGIADNVAAVLTGSLYEAMTTNSASTTAPNLGPTTGVAAADQNILEEIHCIIVTSGAADLELWHGSEGAVNTSVMTNSVARVELFP